MDSIKVKQKEIIAISFLISLLQNTPRLLEIIGLVSYSETYKTTPTPLGLSIRILFLFAYSWVVLQYNSNMNLSVKKFNKTISISTSVLVNGIILYVFTIFYFYLYHNLTGNPLSPRDQKIFLFILIILLLGLIILSKNLRYKLRRRADIQEKEQLRHENLQNELSALKNQVNPHFLFNSLNSLNSMIRDNKEATNFVNQLSYMYRYILQSGQQDLVSLKEELKFIDSYIFLIKARYRDKFSIEIDINKKWEQAQIPVLALQLLIENAVKHNEISDKNPLKVLVYTKDDNLIIENKIQPRNTFVDSTGQGLANINKRFYLLKQKNIQISNENNIFRIKLPLK